MPAPKVDLEALKNTDTLTEEQSAAIALEVLQEEEAAKGKKPEDEPSDEETQETEKDAEIKKTKEEGKEEESGESKPKEEKHSEPEEGLTEEEMVAKAKEDEDAKKKAEEDLNKELAAYAEEHKITVEEAREQFEQSEKIAEKYGRDPKKLAMAALHSQRGYSALEAELKALKISPPQLPLPSSENILRLIEDGKVKLDGKAVSKEEAIEAFRSENPDITEGQDDEHVLKLMVKDIQRGLEIKTKDDIIKITNLAKEKREVLLSKIPETEKRYATKVKELIERVPDISVVNDSFSLEPYIKYAKGETRDHDVKEAEERGYKRGKEEARIIAKRPEGPVGAGAGGDKKKEDGGLTEAEKKEALDMFDNFPDLSEKEKFDMFKEIKEEETKKRSNGGKQ